MKNWSLWLIGFALFIPGVASAGNEGNIWYFGNFAGVDFNSGSPVALTDGQLITSEGCASIADESGDLLFYTDGGTVFDRTHSVMQTGLLGNSSSTQSAIIVPVIDSPTEYYIFTADVLNGANGLAYSIVDMAGNGGLGAVTLLNQPLMPGVQSEKLAVAQHANGTDLWLLSANVQNEYLAFPITTTGVDTTPVVSTVANSRAALADAGYLRVSPDNSTVVAAYFIEDWVELLSFDDNSGQLTLLEAWQLGAVPSAYGVDFSPNSSFFYVSNAADSSVLQYDLATSPVSASGLVLANPSLPPAAVALAPDGKIYIAKFNGSALDSIEQPDIAGAGAGYTSDSVDLNGPVSSGGLPSIPQFLSAPAPEIEVIEVPTASEWGLLALSLLLAWLGLTKMMKRA